MANETMVDVGKLVQETADRCANWLHRKGELKEAASLSGDNLTEELARIALMLQPMIHDLVCALPSTRAATNQAYEEAAKVAEGSAPVVLFLSQVDQLGEARLAADIAAQIRALKDPLAETVPA